MKKILLSFALISGVNMMQTVSAETLGEKRAYNEFLRHTRDALESMKGSTDKRTSYTLVHKIEECTSITAGPKKQYFHTAIICDLNDAIRVLRSVSKYDQYEKEHIKKVYKDAMRDVQS